MRLIATLALLIGCISAIWAQSAEPQDTMPQNLKEVVVVAQENKGVGARSIINRDAMKHLQPTSFADLMELLPGNISQDPKLGQANTISLRETGNLSATGAKTDNDDYAISSLGTQFVVDGAPMNTDANMTYVIGLGASDAAAKRSTVNRGVDMRALSTDNIESVEIVRGIPSAEYGNLTSGLVNIKRIKRAIPFTLRFKADEYSKLFSATKGFGIGETGHTVNVDFGYLDAKTDPRNSLENYKRLTGLVMPTFRFQTEETSAVWSIGLDYAGSFDNFKVDPDLNLNKVDEFESRFNRFALTSNLNISFYDKAWIENIVVNASTSYQHDKMTRRKQVAPTRASVAPSGFEEGEHNAYMLIGEYIADYMVDGNPVSANIKAKMDGNIPLPMNKSAYKIGIEWSFAKNLGKGQVYDLSHPLTASWASRPRAFSDIPALNTMSWFAEWSGETNIANNKLEAQVGVRGMSLVGLGKMYALSNRLYLDPRLNMMWNFPVIDAHKPLRLRIGGGWGKTTRMPTLDYLFPQCHYNDLVQLNYYDSSNPEASAVNVRTYIVDAVNYDLKPASNDKWEVRFGASWGNNNVEVTYFRENMENGFRYTPIYNAYSYRRYDASSYVPGMGSVSSLPYQDARALDGFSVVTNGTAIHKRGIEYVVQTERWMPARTSLIINGAWFKSTYSNSQMLYSPVSDVVGNTPVSDCFVGLYDSRDGRVNEQFNTNFIFDTQVPKWGLLFTTNIQCMCFVKTTRLRENGVPLSFISAEDGMLHKFDMESAANDPMLMHLIKTYNEDSFRTYKIPTAIYINLKVSKQIGRLLRISAFVNRIIDYTPDYKSNGLTVRRSVDAYFGMEAVLTL